MFNKNRFLQFTINSFSPSILFQLIAFLLLCTASSSLAREWRVGQIPNGVVFGCANCHVSPAGGGSRNAFGQAVEQRVSPFGFEEFWDASLAVIDSDGDTFSNGTELGDPDGDGTPTPGVQVFNPGNASSRPATPRPPVVSITTPADNSTFTAPAQVDITASASVVGSTISSVEFFNGGTSLGVDNASPYTITTTLQAGTHSLTARATAANGESATSGAITVTVNPPPSAPVVAITSPANNAILNNASVTVAANATVQGSTIAMVEFFDDANLIGTDQEEPFTATAPLSQGAHVLTAKATAANGQSAVSVPVNITVQLGGTPINDPYPARMAKTDTTIELLTAAEGMTAPLGLAAPNDGSNRLFVFDQIGLIHVVTNGTRLEVPLLDMRSRMITLQAGYDERGLLGLALHPGFATNGLLFTYASYPTAGAATFPLAGQMDHQTVLAEWKIDPANMNRVDPASHREILRIDQPQFNHNGGVMHFGFDGYLYLALGDGGNRDDEGVGHSTQGNGQDLNKILGKLIRIDVNARTSGNGQYGVPLDNPFVGTEGLDEIFAYGFRNPYSWSVDKLTGELYVADVGQGKIEELDRVFKGGNYGWPIKEGTFFFNPAGPDADGFITSTPSAATVPPDLIDPIAEYDHDEGLSIIGGYMYRGTAFPNLIGRYITGDFGLFSAPEGRLFVLDRSEFRELQIGLGDRELGYWIKGFGQDQQGELYVFVSTTLGPSGTTGKMLKLVPPSYEISFTGNMPRNGTNLTLNWTDSGVGPYILESKASLDERAWRTVPVVPADSVATPMDTKNGFMRVRDTAGIRDSAFTVYMTAAAERPPVNNPDALGTGTLVIEGNTLHFDIRYSGLSGAATAAHIHGPASANESTNVLINLQPFTGPAGFGQSGVLSGSVTISPGQKAMILAGKTYVNIHTSANQPGEIRGQIAPVLWMVDLSGANERPTPVDTTGRGSGILMLIGNKLTFDIEYSDLKAAASLAHIHGATNVNFSAPVMIDLAPFNGGAFGTNGTFTGTVTLTPAQLAALLDGQTYVNVHTPAPFHPSGEIRGQIWPKSTAIPLTASLSGAAERPEVVTPAIGTGTFALDGNTLHVNVTYRGLRDVANNMHIHGPAPASTSTGVLINLVPLHVGPFGTNGAIAGSIELTDAQRALILQGRTYVNIHSAAVASGEIRGQIVPSVMHTVLLGASERPTAVHGTGRGRGTLLLSRDQLSMNVTYNGLSSAVAAAHIHGPAPTSGFETVMVGLDPLNVATGTAGSFAGTVPLTAPQLSALIDAITYLNVHTADHGGGEIRGQIIR